MKLIAESLMDTTKIVAGVPVEQVSASYFDPKYLIMPTYKLFRFQIAESRFYFAVTMQDGGVKAVHWYISTTTMLDRYNPMNRGFIEYFMKFNSYGEYLADLKMKAIYGTVLHVAFERIAKNIGFDTSYDRFYEEVKALAEFEKVPFNTIPIRMWHKKVKHDCAAIVRFMQDYDVTPRAVEISLAGRYGTAGSVDLVGDLTIQRKKEKPIRITGIVDLKSRRGDIYLSHKMQGLDYWDHWSANFPSIPIQFAACLSMSNYRHPIGKTVVPYKLTEIFRDGVEDKKLTQYRELLKADSAEGINPRAQYRIKDQVFTVNSKINETMYEILDPASIAEHIVLADPSIAMDEAEELVENIQDEAMEPNQSTEQERLKL